MGKKYRLLILGHIDHKNRQVHLVTVAYVTYWLEAKCTGFKPTVSVSWDMIHQC